MLCFYLYVDSTSIFFLTFLFDVLGGVNSQTFPKCREFCKAHPFSREWLLFSFAAPARALLFFERLVSASGAVYTRTLEGAVATRMRCHASHFDWVFVLFFFASFSAFSASSASRLAA
jgi:hypothetical protein